MAGKKPWNKGLTKYTDDRLRKQGESVSKANTGNPNMKGHGKPSNYKGLPRIQEVKDKISNSKIGHAVSEETRTKISNSLKGPNHPNYGKTFKMDETTKSKISITMKNKRWYNDGINTFFLEPDSPKIVELGLIPGRISWKKA